MPDCRRAGVLYPGLHGAHPGDHHRRGGQQRPRPRVPHLPRPGECHQALLSSLCLMSCVQVLSLPGSVLWATIFFVMLLVLGIDSEFCNVEALVTGMVDNWPDTLLKHRRLFTICLCFFIFCLGVPLVTNVSQNQNTQNAKSLIWRQRDQRTSIDQRRIVEEMCLHR